MKAEEFLKAKPLPKKLCGCGCGDALDENDPQGPQQMVVEGKKVFVNPDCYFEGFGKGVNAHSIGGLGTHGPINAGTLD